jgi:class 3 adenylate cyclase
MASPEVRYARSGDVAVAYQVIGEADETIVYAPHLTNLYVLWDGRYTARFLARVTEAARLIVFNPRGTGLSDRPRNVSLETRMDDVTAVLDAEGLGRATLFGVGESANVCALYAATFPERCERLVLFSPYARLTRSDAYPSGISEDEALARMRGAREHWGERSHLEALAAVVDPRLLEDKDDFEWFVWMHRLSASPAAAADFVRMAIETDITDVLGSIRVPTLVLHRARFAEDARFVAERIPHATIRELGGAGAGPYDDAAADALLAFVSGKAALAVPDSILTTLLFTDIVGSTDLAVELGDRRWREKLEEHRRSVRRTLTTYRGLEVDTAGDGFFCRFDGPARAIACARTIIEDAREANLQIRAGIHTGECELQGDKVAGLAVHVGARVSAAAAAGEVLVSQTVKDLVAGSDFVFQDRGTHELKGIPERWQLYAATS